ncbi:MAG TPA: PKD domain-containing protein [Flavipsychrobacter sp.]|nr:PKD domain-containing protein [Flavipsychrobacter sp.]
MNKVIATLSLLLAFLGFSQKAHAQQIINAYAAVIAEDVSCNNRLVVDSCNGFKEGDTIMIIQMKTYSVDSTNTPSFGDTLAYNGAGNYEYNIIKKIFPNCEFELKYTIKRTYQWTLGKVQIVKVPYFQNYTVANQFLTCKPWDDVTGKGGILAFRVANTLTLDTNIDVTGRGFRGGRPLYLTTPHCNKTDYYYPGNTNEGAEKGEGVGFLSPSKMYGRGKMTNGGGGGAAGKSGGGGGGNGGTGGGGGDQWQAATWCPTDIIPNIGGIGGMRLRYNNFFNTIFLGGGGGSGHGDTLGEIGGGNGGGLVIIEAGNIIGNNRLVISDGANAPECSGTGPNCQSDGGGGGGSGGTILISTPTINNLLQVRAKGGKGATIYSGITVNATYQPGPGGGGGGGVAWFSTAAVPVGVNIDVTGGDRGILPQFNNNANGSQVGQNGLTLNSLILPKPVDTFPIKYNLAFRDSVISCATRKFINTTSPTGVVYSWYWSFGDGTSDTAKSPTHTYAAGGVYTVRLAAQDITGCTDTLTREIVVANLYYTVSDTVLGCRTHQFLGTKAIDSSIFPDATKFHWDFGDGDTAVGNPIIHTYDTGGLYTVVLTVTDSSGCTDTTHFTADIADAMAAFTVNDDTVCQGEQVNFTDASAPNSIFHAWTFGDGYIDSAQNPQMIYPFERVDTVRLIVGNITGCLDTAYHVIVVDSISPVNYIPSDTVLCEGQTIVLDGYYIKDNALGADWDLGDGFTAFNTNPVIHAYDTSGAYNVTLTVRFRACPTVVFSKLVNINPFPVLNLGPDTVMCPNGQAIVLADNVNIGNPVARWTWNTGDSAHSIAVRHPGIYSASVNVNGCVTNDSVEVFKDCYIDIPNAFTPNNDGSNDYFLPRQLLSKSVAKFSMVIYNRWGQEIFQTSSVNGRGWDGMFNGKEQPMGVYVYRINVTFASGATESYTGNLTLIR